MHLDRSHYRSEVTKVVEIVSSRTRLNSSALQKPRGAFSGSCFSVANFLDIQRLWQVKRRTEEETWALSAWAPGSSQGVCILPRNSQRSICSRKWPGYVFVFRDMRLYRINWGHDGSSVKTKQTNKPKQEDTKNSTSKLRKFHTQEAVNVMLLSVKFESSQEWQQSQAGMTSAIRQLTNCHRTFFLAL